MQATAISGRNPDVLFFIDFNLVKESVTDPAESFPDLWLY